MNQDIWTTIAAPVVVGVFLWLLAELVRYLLGRRSAWLRRRRRIVGGVARASTLIQRAIRDRLYDEAWIQESDDPLVALRAQYEDLTVDVLDLFEPGEEIVAFWTAVELYGAFRDPQIMLKRRSVPRVAREDGYPLVGLGGGGYLLPRTEMLLSWARGKSIGPRYATLGTDGDSERHNAVYPNSDANVGLIRPPVWLVRDKLWRQRKVRPWHRPPSVIERSEYGL